MAEFRHIEYCMGTAFQYWGRSDLDPEKLQEIVKQSCDVLHHADEVFSLYKHESPLRKLARGETSMTELADEVNFVWDQCDYWEKEANGWFSAMTPENTFDPSGLVKALATEQAGMILEENGVLDFAINAGGDIRLSKEISGGLPKRIAISKPVSISENSGAITVLDLNNTDFYAVATSGTAERGHHIWNPKQKGFVESDLLQVTVVAEDIITADVFATAAFAAGKEAGKLLSDNQHRLEALVIDLEGDTFATAGFQNLVSPS